MKEYQLFEAVGDSEERFLMELEETPSRRLPKHFGLAAALIALMLTACAAPVVIRNFDKLKNAQLLQSEEDKVWYNYEGEEGFRVNKSGVVTLTVEKAEDAPETLEEIYIPMEFLQHGTIDGGRRTETQLSLEFSAQTSRSGRVEGLLYQQRVIPGDGHMEITDVVEPGVWQQATYGFDNLTALNIFGEPIMEDAPEQFHGRMVLSPWTINHIFWSDGHYLYCLRYPMELGIDETELEEIITSLTGVEDLSQYLPKME